MIARRVLRMCVMPLLVTMAVLHGQKPLVSAAQPSAVDRAVRPQALPELLLPKAAATTVKKRSSRPLSAARRGKLQPQLGSAVTAPGDRRTALGGAGTDSDDYLWDDGTAENSLGLTAGGALCWIHHFNRANDGEVRAAISTSYGTPAFPGGSGVSPGQEVRVFLWEDTGGAGNAADAVLLTEAVTVADAGSIETDVLQKIFITPTALPASFFIGATVTHAAGFFPGPMDESAPDGESWVHFNGPPFNPNDMGGALYMPGIGFNVDWLLRGNIVLGDCGNGACEVGENQCTCPEDCGAGGCGDDICCAADGEDCASCPDDCGDCPFCGDGECADGEDCETCPEDCGPCGAGACCGVKGDPAACDEGLTEEECEGPGGAGGNYAGDDTVCDDCPDPACFGAEGSCFEPQPTPGCASEECCGIVCNTLPDGPFCCEVFWDEICVGLAEDLCPPASCGDGSCDPGEDCENCPGDCGICPFCGDGEVNLPGEDCDPPDDGACPGQCDANCQCPVGACCLDGPCLEDVSQEDCTEKGGDFQGEGTDCSACPTCGDGECTKGEDCESCVEDCGACPVCGDGECADGEDCETCTTDCGPCISIRGGGQWISRGARRRDP